MTMSTCRFFNATAISLALVSGAAQAQAQLTAECTDILRAQRMTIMVPNAPGGGFDIYARALGPVLAQVAGANVRVSNMPGGGGQAAITRLITAPPTEFLALIDSANDLVSSVLHGDLQNFGVEDFEVIGIVHQDPMVWLTDAGVVLTDPATARLVSAGATIEGNLVPVGMTAAALGLDVSMVAGYSGSSENIAAILRGEVDISALSSTTAMRAQQTTDARIALVLADQPHPDLPDVPWLAGEDGLAAQLSANLPEDVRAQRMTVASTVAVLSNEPRTFFVSAAMEPTRKACFEAAFAVALTSAEFRAEAEARNRPVEPVVGEAARQIVARIADAIIEAAPLVDAMQEKYLR